MFVAIWDFTLTKFLERLRIQIEFAVGDEGTRLSDWDANQKTGPGSDSHFRKLLM